jgi:hypothetical protein
LSTALRFSQKCEIFGLKSNEVGEDKLELMSSIGNSQEFIDMALSPFQSRELSLLDNSGNILIWNPGSKGSE